MQNNTPTTTFTAICKHVFDGDSFTAHKEGEENCFEIRLYGIDAPERGQEYAKQARERLIKLIRNKSIRVEQMDTDRYGRCVAKVYRGDTYVNLEMLRLGLAWHYTHHAGHDAQLLLAALDAQNAGLGLWQAPAPIPPRQWRREKAAKAQTDVIHDDNQD